jgi:predicted ATP-dependent endonuclease of OLD family
MELSNGDAQVLVTTHSPYFIDVQHFDSIKMFRNVSGSASISKSSFSSVLENYNAAFTKALHNQDQARTKLAIQTQPKFNEIFFAEKVVLVEGISDLACIEAYLRLSGRKRDFQKSGATIVVCEGKSSLALMLLIVKTFGIPYHVIFDCDSGYEALFQKDQPKYQSARNEHIRDNDAILSLAGYNKLGKFPDAHIFEENLTGWHIDIEAVLEQEFSTESESCHQAGRNAVGNLSGSKKHPLYVAASIAAAWDAGRKFPVLEKVVDALLK